jgi:xanthosine utilization system XapX-like protein
MRAVPDRLAPLLLALGAGVAVGIGYPYVEIALACREPSSEACVWGKAYFSLTLTVSLVLLGPIAAGVVYALLAWRRRWRHDGTRP